MVLGGRSRGGNKIGGMEREVNPLDDTIITCARPMTKCSYYGGSSVLLVNIAAVILLFTLDNPEHLLIITIATLVIDVLFCSVNCFIQYLIKF